MTSVLRAEQGEASLSMADVDQSGVGKKNAQRATAADMGGVEAETSTAFGVVAYVTYLVCAATSTTAVLALVWEQSIVVFVSMCFALVNSAAVARQRSILEDGDALRKVINNTRKAVNDLMRLNVAIAKSNDDVQHEVTQLMEVESTLDGIVQQQGRTASEFVNDLQQNKSILRRMEHCLKTEAVQEIIEQVLQSDRDQDFHIDPEEIDMLMLRLQNIEGIVLNEEVFKQRMASGGYDLHSILKLCHGLLEDDEEEDGKLFEIDDDIMTHRAV